MNSNKTFAGIGACKIPDALDYFLQQLLRKTAFKLCYEMGYSLNTNGADTTARYFQQGLMTDDRDPFAEGCLNRFLPRDGFNGHDQGIVMSEDLSPPMQRARDILIANHVYPFRKGKIEVPRFIALKGEDRSQLSDDERWIATLHALKVFQILGPTLDAKVKMVICWTPDGAINRKQYKLGITGGAGIAINLADALGIEVFNLRRPEHMKRICKFVGMEPPADLPPLTAANETEQTMLDL